MKRYILLPFIISILGHGIFFGIFRSTVPVQTVVSSPKFYIISSGQVKHEMSRNITLTPLAGRLSGKSPIWASKLNLSKGIDPISLHRSGAEEPMQLTLEKTHTLGGLAVPIEWKILPKQKVLPRFSDLFQYKLPSKIVNIQGEKVVILSNNIQLSYYIQGPISGREIQISNLPSEVERAPAELKLRFWVSTNGRVNQVIIEEGSGFRIIDKKMVDTIKEWRFRPIYVPSAPRYQWGIIKIRIQG